MNITIESLIDLYKDKFVGIDNKINASQANQITDAIDEIDYWNECAVNRAYSVIMRLFNNIRDAAMYGQKFILYRTVEEIDSFVYICDNGTHIQLMDKIADFFRREGYNVLVAALDDLVTTLNNKPRFIIKISWDMQ
jgi:hypothetical protein